jgi:hypothetical protein
VAAVDNGAFPAIGSSNNVWNNDNVDGSFGVTPPIFLDQITPGRNKDAHNQQGQKLVRIYLTTPQITTTLVVT